MSRRVLMIAYHFPPFAGSSGIQRTLRFVQNLPSQGWKPLVLTVRPFAYEQRSDDLESEIPAGLVIRRAIALDAARHLSIGGKYIADMARPDRWMTWRWDGVRVGMQMIRQFNPDVIWSTYPIASAHIIGAELHRKSNLPWIADFRDPMAQEGYPRDPITWQQFRDIEETAMMRAAASVFTTPGAERAYRARYPNAASRLMVIENGYDEATFDSISVSRGQRATDEVVFLHSGIVYPSERDPTQLFAALRLLLDTGRVRPGEIKVRFRAAVHDDLLQSLSDSYKVAPLVDIEPPLPYREALAEMLSADALLVLQASNCNEQIPAKLYEYLRARRPIVALTDPTGDTAYVLRRAGIQAIAPLDSASAIAELLVNAAQSIRAGVAPTPDRQAVAGASRQARTVELARLLDSVVEALPR